MQCCVLCFHVTPQHPEGVLYLFRAPRLTYPSEESVFVSSRFTSNNDAQEKHGGWSGIDAQWLSPAKGDTGGVRD